MHPPSSSASGLQVRFPRMKWRFRRQRLAMVRLFCIEEIVGLRKFSLHQKSAVGFRDYGATLIGAATLPMRLPRESRTTNRTVYSPGGS